jgi:hypothetical protein
MNCTHIVILLFPTFKFCIHSVIPTTEKLSVFLLYITKLMVVYLKLHFLVHTKQKMTLSTGKGQEKYEATNSKSTITSTAKENFPSLTRTTKTKTTIHIHLQLDLQLQLNLQFSFKYKRKYYYEYKYYRKVPKNIN